MKRTSVAIIGVGAVGSSIAYTLLSRDICAEIVLIDIDRERCAGEVRDLADTLGMSNTSLLYQGTYEDVKRADIIIISAGRPQKVGESRSELLGTNSAILESIFELLNGVHSEAIIIVVANPLDCLTYLAQKISNLPRSQIFGTGTFLDSQRLKYHISTKIGVAPQSIDAFVLGEHGDSQMVAWSSARVAGSTLDCFGITEAEQDRLATLVKHEAYEIIKAKGATFYGIATCVARLCEMVIFDTKEIVPVSWYHEQYQVCLSLPVVLGASGVRGVVDYPLTDKEKKLLEESATTLRKSVE